MGWLVVEDLDTVLVLLPHLAGVLGGTPAVDGTAPLWRTIGQKLLGVSAFVALMRVAGRRALTWMLWRAPARVNCSPWL